MKFFYFNQLLICAILMLFSQFVNAQNAISEKISQNLAQIQNAASYTPLEAMPADEELKSRITDEVLSRKQFFQIQTQTVQTIRNKDSEYLRITIPIAGADTELQLIKTKIFTDDFRAVAASKPDTNLEIDIGTHYRGTVKGADKSLAVISFFDDEILGLIQLNDAQYTLGKVPESDAHILYKNKDLNVTSDFSCKAIEGDKPTIIGDNIAVEKSMMNCVRVHVEADYSLYQHLGSNVNNITNYIGGVFTEVATLYDNENIAVEISFLRIWNVPSPYGNNTELDDLDAQNYGRTEGDFVHLIHRNSLSGVAWLNVLCNSSRNTGASGVHGAFNNVPAYSWDVNVIAHELGHNLGSPHTHGCVWNGNGTPIDGCGPAEGFSEGCNGPIPSAGTIMSYCHLVNGVGINFNLGFGTQPGNLIRNRVNTATCLTSCTQPTCDDGAQNGDETGIDCGGTSCPPCPPCADLTITINLDNYPEETSWEITNDAGTVVASGGTYGSQPDGSTVVETVCLPDDCYNFIISDAYGDGICCAFGMGSYNVTDQNGNILASGGQFGSSETTAFCANTSAWQTCDPIIDLGTASLSTGTVHAQNEVISAGTIPASTNVSLKAGQCIQLDNGFNADANADTEIIIENCVPD